MPSRSAATPAPAVPRYPYLKLAALLRERIAAGALQVGDFLPGQKTLAAEHGVSVGTAHRAVSQLAQDGLVKVVPGHGFRVISAPTADPPMDEPVKSGDRAVSTTALPDLPTPLLDLVLRHRGQVIPQFSAEADPTTPPTSPTSPTSSCPRSNARVETLHEPRSTSWRCGGAPPTACSEPSWCPAAERIRGVGTEMTSSSQTWTQAVGW
jgi:hypothetical protein